MHSLSNLFLCQNNELLTSLFNDLPILSRYCQHQTDCIIIFWWFFKNKFYKNKQMMENFNLIDSCTSIFAVSIIYCLQCYRNFRFMQKGFDTRLYPRASMDKTRFIKLLTYMINFWSQPNSNEPYCSFVIFDNIPYLLQEQDWSRCSKTG